LKFWSRLFSDERFPKAAIAAKLSVLSVIVPSGIIETRIERGWIWQTIGGVDGSNKASKVESKNDGKAGG
jgi:hypothetical protein